MKMEEWNAGMFGVRAEINLKIVKKLLQTHHSITSSFLPRENLFYFTGAIIPSRVEAPMGRRPIGAKPLIWMWPRCV